MAIWHDYIKELYQTQFLNSTMTWDQIETAVRQKYPIETAEKRTDFVRGYIRAKDWYKAKTKNNITYENKKECSINDVDNLIIQVKELQKANNAIDLKQTKASITIEDSKPICIAWWSDWHLGGMGVDYDKFEEHRDIIANTDGLYWIGGGDYKDAYSPKMPFGQNEQLVPVGTQDLWVSQEMGKVGSNCIALVRGCHDDWEHQQSDKDFVQYICDKINAINLWHGGDIHIKIGSQSYHFKCRHKYKFESSLNTLNSMRRIMEIQGECDVACVAHLHNVDFEQRHLMGKLRTMMRAGGYKVWDEHGQKLAGYKGKIGVPCVILDPDKKEATPMLLENAVKYLTYLRGHKEEI